MFTLPSEPLRKRASTAALREEACPRKSRKGDQDMNDGVGPEIVTKEARSKRVHKIVRQRVRRYCCECEKETGRSGMDKKAGAYETETVDTCVICQHPFCLDCLHENIARRGGSVKAI